MKKYIIVLFVLIIFLIVFISRDNNDVVITRIEEDSSSMIAINYPHTRIKEIDKNINDYVKSIYNNFKKGDNYFKELNIDFDQFLINDTYNIITLKTYLADYKLNTNSQDFYTLIYDIPNKKLKSVNDFINENTISYLQKTIIKNYHDCISIDNLLTLKIDHSFTLDNNKFTVYYSTPNCGLINVSLPSFLNDNSETFNYIPFNIIINKQKIDINKPIVALTFDDGPSKYTKKIIEYLYSEEVTGTFFVLGNKVKSYNQTLTTMLKYGNEIGNHTYNHKWLSRLTNDEIKNQITKTQDIIYDTAGYTPTALRPTYGSRNKKITSNTSLDIVFWDIDTFDWRIRNTKRIANRVINRNCDGKIILMHDTYERTLKALKIIVPELKEKGYQFVTISELKNVKYLRYLNDLTH